MARRGGAVHVVTTRRHYKDRVYETHLLRRTYREGGTVRNETVGNLSHLPAETIELVRRSLRGERFLSVDESFAVEQSLPHGHVEAALAMARRLELARLLDRRPSRERQLVLAMLVERVLHPASKLATARGLADSTLASELGVEGADEDDLYLALDWLSQRQQAVERRLTRRHLRAGEHALYDVSSSYFEGRSCPLAQLGYSRDRRRGSLQLVYGLLCDRRGRPLAVEVFPGSLHDNQTVPDRLAALTERFGLKRLVLCVDRGMVTEANLAAIGQAGFAFISALRAPQVKRLAKSGALQLSLLDQLDLAEIKSDDFPGERLVVCRNPLVEERKLQLAPLQETLHLRGPEGRDEGKARLPDRLQVGLGDHAAVDDEDEPAKAEALRERLQPIGQSLVVVQPSGEDLGRERPAKPVAEQAVDELERAPPAVARVAELGKRAGAALEVARGDVIEGVLAGAQVAPGEPPLDRLLALLKPVERPVEVVLVRPLKPELRGERGVGEAPRRGELRGRIEDALDEQGEHE